MRLYRILEILIFLLVGCLGARADIGLLLDAKPNVTFELGNELTGAGHAGVYLSRVCTVSPVELRLCEPGELGSVIQNYENYGEDAPYEWNAVPVSVYLYGVDDPRDRPLFASPELRSLLQDQYRTSHLQQVCTTEQCIHDPGVNWRDSVAAAFVREIYIFQVSTTPEQDERFIREFNERANVNHYSGFANNCADFAKFVVNTYFPHSAHRNVLNDLGMTSPKAIARSFTHYAEHHPELHLQVIRIEQLPGTYKRSSDCREGTEQIFRSKKWLIPTAAVGYYAMPVLAASYLLTGRFNPDRELRKHPSSEAALLHEEAGEANLTDDPEQRLEVRQRLQLEQERQTGTPEQWTKLQQRFNEVLQTAIADGVISDRRELRKLFAKLQSRGRVHVDPNRQSWLMFETGGQMLRVGLTRQNILSPESDQRLAMQLLLARTESLLFANPKHRPLYPEMQAELELLARTDHMLRSPSSSSIVTGRQNAP